MCPSSGPAPLNAGLSSRSPVGTAIARASNPCNIAMAGRLGSGPALDPQ